MQPNFHLFIQRRMSQIKQWPLVSILLALTVLVGWSSMPASAQTEQSHWLGRPVGTEYVFDVRLPQDFADMLTASGPEYAAFRDFPEPSTEVIDGETYSFVTTEVKWDRDAIDNGQIAFAQNGRVEGSWWQTMDKESAEWPAVAQEVKAQATGDDWKAADLFVLIWPGAGPPTIRVPIPETTLAMNAMVELGQQTRQGLYYPAVTVPADLDAFRAQMLAYGNVGRRDPDFRKNNGSQTATDLSGNTVNTQGGTQEIFKQSQTPPYFADHVMTDSLNRLAQFQAEYTASIQSVTHDGPGSFRDPNTGETVNMATLGARADHFGVSGVWEAAGGGGLGEFPRAWMVGETHFRPWFNVNGCVPEIGYGAAKGANGSWYFVAAGVTRNDDCLNESETGEPTPAVSTTPTPAAGSAGQGVQTDLCANIPASNDPSSATVRFVNLESGDVGIHVYPYGEPMNGDSRRILRPGQTYETTVSFDSSPYYFAARLDYLWIAVGGMGTRLDTTRNDITNETPNCIVFGDPSATTAPEPPPNPAQQQALCADIPASSEPDSSVIRFVNLEPVQVGVHAYPYGEPMNGDSRFTLGPGQTREITAYFNSTPYYVASRLDYLWLALGGMSARLDETRNDITRDTQTCIVFGDPSSATGVDPSATALNSPPLPPAQRAAGRVVAWGNNGFEQLAIPDGLTDVVEIDAGFYHSLALKRDGTVVAWGQDIAGETMVPAGLTDVVDIAAGGYESIALKSDGTVVTWGSISSLDTSNIPATLTDVVAVDAGAYHYLVLKADGTVVAWGQNENGQTDVPADLTDVVAISANRLHNLALKQDGTVVAWGSPALGRTDVPPGLVDVATVVAGEFGGLAVKNDGTVVLWGDSLTGVPETVAALTEIEKVSDGGLALKTDGTVTVWNSGNVWGQLDIPVGLSDVIDITSGDRHSLALVETSAAPPPPEPTSTPEPTPAATPTPVPPSASGDQPPPLISYTFTPEESKILPGTSTEVGTQWGCSDTNTIADEDKIGRLAVVTLIYQTGCWTDGRYNHSNYQVERGQVTGSNGTALEAYRVHPPNTLATNFLGSKHAIYYQFPSQEAYTVYTFDGSTTKKVLDVEASQIVADGYTKLEALTLSENSEPVTYIFAPSGQDPSVYTEIAPGVEAAQLPPTELGDLVTYRFAVTGTPFDTVRDFTAGPAAWANLYSHAREFFPVPLTSGVGVIWQDQANQAILLTILGGDLQSQQTLSLPNNRNELLAAATSDGQETLYYLTIQDGGQDQNIARTATLYRVNQQGALLQSQSLDTSPSGLNISHFGNWMADMRLSNGQLGIMVARRLHRGGDGLQHQSGMALVYQADTLALVKNLGQTSGHSFDNVLITNQAGEFVGIDLGDNYPRGVHLHKFTDEDNRARSKVVYTFKTEHGTKSSSPAGRSYPRYSEISGGGITYYQWSNDNRTYTELGGVVEGANGYTVVFAGETAPGGLSLLNGRAKGEELNDPRNVGLVQVRPDFESQDDFVLSQGVSESGGFYTFGGTWSPQSHKGIVWLTDYMDKDQENASRLKTVKLPDGNILLIWEKWTADSYVNTYAMKVSESGQKLTEPVELGSEVRLGRRDDPLVSGGKVYLFAGDKVAQKLIVTVLEP